MIVYLLISIIDVDIACYRFNECYVELWYRIPVSSIFSIDELIGERDTTMKKYAYQLIVYSTTKSDTAIKQGVKGSFVETKKYEGYFIDRIPLYLYPGHFSYVFEISSGGAKTTRTGELEILSDTIPFTSSDIILFKKNKGEDSIFIGVRDGLIPLIEPEYTPIDTLYSYLEVYCLMPDSLFYTIHYTVIDSNGKVVFDKCQQRLKQTYIHPETISVALVNFYEGLYHFKVEIIDQPSEMKIIRDCSFRIKEILPEIADKKFAREIQYLVSKDEYKKFCEMNNLQQLRYLQKFWAKRDYLEFERRLLYADEKFSTLFLKGRNTPQGKYYILHGPPDEIFSNPFPSATRQQVRSGGPHMGEPQEVWVYEKEGLQVIFRDINKDGIYELIGTSKLGKETIYDYLQEREELRKYLFD